MNTTLASHDLLWIVVDALRYDVADAELRAGRTPNLARLGVDWEKRHTPGNFTLPAHVAFFSGFLPTPADAAADHQRLFAAAFAGSETIGPHTKTFEAPDVLTGFRQEGFRTVCIGGVGFFNQLTPMSSLLPKYFCESHWCPEFGVTAVDSPKTQMAFAANLLGETSPDQKLLLFMNLSAVHQPNYFYARENGPDDLHSHAAALHAVDAALPEVLTALSQRRRPVFWIVCSDHGTAYGEDGFWGHRAGHPVVWTVPYAHGFLKPQDWRTA